MGVNEKRIIIAGGPSGGDGVQASEVPTDLLDLTIMGEDFLPDESTPYELAVIAYDEDSPNGWKLVRLVPWYVQSSAVMLPSGHDLDTDDGDIITGSGTVDGVDVSLKDAERFYNVALEGASMAVPVVNSVLYMKTGVGWAAGYTQLITGGGYTLSLSQKNNLTDLGFTSLHKHSQQPYGVYDGAGRQNLSTTAVTVNLDTELFANGNYSLATDEITFNSDGYYYVHYDASWDETDLTGGARGTIKFWLEDDTSGSYATSVGSIRRAYLREATDGSGISGGTILNLSDGDKVRLRAQQFTAGPKIETAANETSVKCWLIR